jgi:ADP-ribose pyrophosphatase YjhB (NUDIX family)
MNQRLNKRAAAVIIKDGKILLMRRVKNGREYFVFPGGGIENIIIKKILWR